MDPINLKTHCTYCNDDIEDFMFCSTRNCDSCVSGRCFSEESVCLSCCPHRQKQFKKIKSIQINTGKRKRQLESCRPRIK